MKAYGAAFLLSIMLMFVSCFSVQASTPDYGRLCFTTGTISVEKGYSGISAEWLNEEAYGEPGYYLVHFEGIIRDEWRSSLEKKGISIISYIPWNGYLVKAETKEQAELLSQAPHIDWTGLYQPVLKVMPGILERIAGRARDVKLRVLIFPGEPFENAAAVIRKYEGRILAETENAFRRKVSFTVEAGTAYDVVRELAFLAEVEWIQEYPDYELCNNQTMWVVQSGLYAGQTTPVYERGIKGAGQLIGVMDTGVDADMCYFYDTEQGLIPPNQPPDFDQRKIVSYLGPSEYVSGYDTQGHGTHTAGTIAGDDFANEGEHDDGDGIAVEALLIVQDYGDSWDVYPPDDEYSAHQEVYDIGGMIHSNSWGWPGNAGYYHDDCAEVDQFTYDKQDYLMIYAAGNEYYYADRIRPPGVAKNVVTVGATQPGSSAENMADFSSHGPTDDGRIKPDVAICGENIYSASVGTSCSTTSGSGTSMATPGMAGATALIRQYFTDGFYPLGAANPDNAMTPSAALMKAMLINSAVNMTGAYTEDAGTGHDDIPTFGQGWGRVLLDNALYFEGDARKLYVDDHREGITTGETIEYYIGSVHPDEPLEVTLVWTDPPSVPGAAVNLINDLNLTVSYQGDEYKGNVYSGGVSVTGGTYDVLNNVECVRLESPENGTYHITVTGFNIPEGPQNFALAVTGALGQSDGIIALDHAFYNCSQAAQITVQDEDLQGQGVQDIEIISDTDTEGETVSLQETPQDSGTFTGAVQFTEFSPGAGELQVTHGDTVTAIYIDADDGHGGHNVEKTDDAVIDCEPPVISDVHVAEFGAQRVVIAWNTDEPSTGEIHYGASVPPAFVVNDDAMSLEHSMEISGLNECTEYFYSVTARDAAENVVTDDAGGAYYDFITYETEVYLEFNMDTDPGWYTEAHWSWGQPTGQGGAHGGPDPSSGYTGANVFGYQLDGDYTNNMPERHLTAGPFDFTEGENYRLGFYRWLGVERSLYDHAYVRVSKDGIDWTNVWENPDAELYDGEWTYVEYDITEQAAGEPSVYIRWTMGATDVGWTYCGWNIDDVVILREEPCGSIPTPVPTEVTTLTPTHVPTLTPTATDTLTPTDTPTRTPTLVPTETPSRTPTQVPTSTPTFSPTATATVTNTPSLTPTSSPTRTPTDTPTSSPTATPTHTHTLSPTNTPTNSPTGTPTATPTNSPTGTPTDIPTQTPTQTPSDTPTSSPSQTLTPTDTPTNIPTDSPTFSPTSSPTMPPPTPTYIPTIKLTPLFTATPPTVIPSPTGTIPPLGVKLDISAEYFCPGSLFNLDAAISNPGPETYLNQPFVVLLDVFGSFFWHPGWQTDFDFVEMNVETGIVNVNIFHFTWPETGSAEAQGLKFYGALLTESLNDILGDFDMIEFGYGPLRLLKNGACDINN